MWITCLESRLKGRNGGVMRAGGEKWGVQEVADTSPHRSDNVLACMPICQHTVNFQRFGDRRTRALVTIQATPKPRINNTARTSQSPARPSEAGPSTWAKAPVNGP